MSAWRSPLAGVRVGIGPSEGRDGVRAQFIDVAISLIFVLPERACHSRSNAQHDWFTRPVGKCRAVPGLDSDEVKHPRATPRLLPQWGPGNRRGDDLLHVVPSHASWLLRKAWPLLAFAVAIVRPQANWSDCPR